MILQVSPLREERRQFFGWPDMKVILELSCTSSPPKHTSVLPTGASPCRARARSGSCSSKTRERPMRQRPTVARMRRFRRTWSHCSRGKHVCWGDCGGIFVGGMKYDLVRNHGYNTIQYLFLLFTTIFY